MARYAGTTTVHQVQQVWQAADLRPHRLQNFKISNDPHFAEKVVDVVGLYMNPPENAVVLSVDELERRALYRGAFGSVQELREAIRQFIDAHNVYGAKPFRWTKSAEVILAKVERAKQSIARRNLN